ncbi:MAG: ABC transporter permease [Oscillospiraceae bacterium]|nr:ABC transporter permease [Oscillospiraceae bacterium]
MKRYLEKLNKDIVGEGLAAGIAAFQRFRRTPAFTGFALFTAMLVINVAVQGPANFFTVRNMNTLFSKNAAFILVAMAQSLLLISGVLNVSVGVTLALVNVVAIMGHEAWGLPLPVAWMLGVAFSIAASMLCGLCVSSLRLPAMLASFSMTMIIKGVNVYIMPIPQGSVPPIIYRTYDSSVLGFIPFSAIIIGLVFCYWLYLKRTRFGKHIYAVGGSPRNAYAAGIDPVRTQLKAFFVSGAIVGIAGLCLTSMTASGNPLQGDDYGIRSLSACIIGGLGFGGWGSVSCGLFGAGFMVLIQNTVYHTFTLLYKLFPGFTVSSFWQNLLSDIIVFGGLLMTIVTARAQRETLKQGFVKQFKRGERLGK